MPANHRYANLPLLNKVLLPYVLLLLALAIATSVGSSYLLQTWLHESTQSSLNHIQKQIYSEFKDLEQQLNDHAEKIGNEWPVTLEDIQKDLSAHNQRFTAVLYSGDNPNLPPQFVPLIKQARLLTPTKVTVMEEQNKGHILATCLWLDTNRYLFILHPIDSSYLDKMAARYDSNFYFFNQRGTLIAKNQQAKGSLSLLEESQLSELRSGVSFSDMTNTDNSQLISYSALPLGQKGIFLLGSAKPLNLIDKLVLNHRLYLLAITGLSLLICITLFRSLLMRLFRPLNGLLETFQKVSAGDRSARARIEEKDRSQLVELCTASNQYLDLLDEKDEKLVKLEAQLQNLEDLKSHNQHLRKTNLELETRAVSLKEQNQEFSALFQVTQSMVSSLDQRLLNERIMQALKESLNCTICVLYIFQPGSDKLTAVKVQGLYGIDLKSITVELGCGLAGNAALNQQLDYAPDLLQREEKPCYGNEVVSVGSLLSVPMTIQNRLIGVINLHQNTVDAFSKTSQKIAQALANQAAIAIENARLYEKTKTLSATDELTGLSNRRQFQEYLLRELAQSRRHNNSFSILMIDIDHFKLYNDFHGHLKGDIVLKRVASLLVQNTRGVDLVARFGGEEFVLLLPKSGKRSSLAVADKLRIGIEKEYFSGAENSQPGQRLTISVGVAHFPTDSSDIYDLMNLADTALYEAKRQGRNKCITWNPTLLPADEKKS